MPYEVFHLYILCLFCQTKKKYEIVTERDKFEKNRPEADPTQWQFFNPNVSGTNVCAVCMPRMHQSYRKTPVGLAEPAQVSNQIRRELQYKAQSRNAYRS